MKVDYAWTTQRSKNMVNKNSPSTSTPLNSGKMVLRIKMAKNNSSKVVEDESNYKEEEEFKPSSGKRSMSLSNKGKKMKMKKKKMKTKTKTKNDGLKPKKPPTAFFFFLQDFRKTYQEENPEVKSMQDVGKACGEKWKIMTYEDKVKYYDVATEKRVQFDRAMADYTKRKERGEVPDSDLSESSDE